MRHGLSSDWHTLTFGRKLANRQKKFRWAPLPDSVYMMELISFSEFVLVTCACTYQPLWSCPTLCHPMDFSLPGSPWDSRGRNTGVDCHALPQGNLPDPGIKPASPALQADSFPIEPPRKPIIYIIRNNCYCAMLLRWKT